MLWDTNWCSPHFFQLCKSWDMDVLDVWTSKAMSAQKDLIKGRLKKSGNLLRQMIVYVYSIYRHKYIYIYIHDYLFIWIEPWGVETWLPQGLVFFGDPRISTKQKLATVPVGRRRSHPCPPWPFCGGLLSSRDAAVFWALQSVASWASWLSPVYAEDTSDAKSIDGFMRDGKKMEEHRFFCKTWISIILPPKLSKVLNKNQLSTSNCLIFSAYLRHVHHHHPSSQVDPCTVSSSYVKSAERRSQPLKKLQPRKLRSNWASGNEAKFWDESSYNLDHLTYITPLGGSSQLVSG